MRIPLIAGRALGEGDGAEAPRVALVSQVLAERYFSGDDPVGRRFKLAEDGEWITIVGVVGDVVYDWFANRRNPTVYVPLAQDPTLRLALAARSAGNPEGLMTAVRQAVAAADTDQPILTLRTMERVVTDRVAGVDYFAKVLTVMSGLALVLALTGMYSLMAFLAARSTKEVGVRVALGATTRQVTWLAASRAARITAGGLRRRHGDGVRPRELHAVDAVRTGVPEHAGAGRGDPGAGGRDDGRGLRAGQACRGPGSLAGPPHGMISQRLAASGWRLVHRSRCRAASTSGSLWQHDMGAQLASR